MKPNDLTRVQHLTKELKKIKKTVVKVGLPADVGSYQDGTSVLDVGTMHEFGLGVPRRSFIRMPMEKEKGTIKKALDSGFRDILNGGETVKNLNKVGLVAQNISKNAFKTQGYGEWKDISQATKDAKGSSKILFDTGRLVQSVVFWIAKGE